ncbi:hypothetical protein GCM10023195_25890 [Actinoallomurus liliacearum]|uniref:DUF3558 domain-containing protein n=1 Tax=Actinoallomurus liliacearum TaxID=1080073 RepID=A0ABP8TFI3_9ACTN
MPARRRLILACASAAVAAGFAIAACWYVGLLTSDGRFAPLDACRVLPPPEALAPLVRNGAREPGDSRPRTMLGWGGDAASECKWSSVPSGQDRPFRTVRLRIQTLVHNGHVSGAARAERNLAGWARKAGAERPVIPVHVGEGGYARVDALAVQVLFRQTVIYDVHVQFRISNALVDVSARTHTRPDAPATALVRNLAETTAHHLPPH